MTQPLPMHSAAVIALHDSLLARSDWPHQAPAAPERPQADGIRRPPPEGVSQLGSGPSLTHEVELWKWAQVNHRNNCLLWAEEDLARRTRVADAEIAANKRAIDGYNQARNDATERVDELLLIALGLVDWEAARSEAPMARLPEGARLNSETAGSIVDRLSILSLKIRAMREQSARQDVAQGHRDASAWKLQRLGQQRADLASCLDALLADTASGRACFRVYRQFKMYNDPAFNPQLVKESQQP